MRTLLALAFLALARAAIIEVPKTIIEDEPYIDPTWTSEMFSKYGLMKPLYDDVSTWSKSFGVEDPLVLNHLRSYYDKPALVFFQDPAGRVVSYYAHEGIDKPGAIPEMRSAMYGLYGASDRMAIDFHPEHLLGHYKTVLPGHFFEPIKNIELSRFMNDMPLTTDHVTFKPKTMYKDFWNKFDIEDLPMIYKDPVALDIGRKYMSEGVVPHVSPFTGMSAAVPFGYGRSAIIPETSHLASAMPFTSFSDLAAAGAVPYGYGRSAIIPSAAKFVSAMPFTGFSDVSGAVPFKYGKSAIIPGASHLVSDLPYAGFRSALGVTPAVKSAAYHLVKADMPYFTAAPAAGFVDSAAAGFPLVKTTSPLIAADSATLSAGAFAPVHAIAPVHAAAPIFTSPFAKAAVPCVNCLGAEHAFAPAIHAGAGVIPLVKTFGDVGLTHFGAADAAYKSAFTGMTADPAMAFGAAPTFVKAAPVTSFLASPYVGLTGHPAGLAASPFTWKKY